MHKNTKEGEKNCPESAFQRFLTVYKPKKVLLMVSGGVDSMVLLHVAQKYYKNSLYVLHINHNTRLENQKDKILIQNTCEKLDIPHFYEELTTIPQKNKEKFWRNERIRIKNQYIQKTAAEIALTAHHATDLMETVLLRLIKGCGIAGFSPFETKTKPFWQLSKKILIQYAKKNNITWNEDASNKNMAFDRNKIRTILPVLESITANTEQIFIKNCKRFLHYNNFIEKHIQNLPNPMPIMAFNNLTMHEKTEWIRFYATNKPSQAEITDFLRWIANKPAGNSQKSCGKQNFTIKKGNIVVQSTKELSS